MPRVYNRRSTLTLLVLGLALAACGGPSPTAAPGLTPAPPTVAAPTPAPTATAAPAPTETPEPLAARVDGRPIRLADYQAEVGRCQAAQAFPDCPERALRSLIEQAVTAQAAEAAGLRVGDAELDAELDRITRSRGGAEAFAAWLEANGYTAEAFRAALRQDLLRARLADQVTAAIGETAEQVHAQALLVRDEALARDLLAQLQAGADFATLALAYSLDLSSRVAGGDLGWFPRGWLTVPEVEQAAFALQPGETSAVIQSALGFHIVRVLERDPARPLSPAAQRALREQTWQAWLDARLAQAVIETPVGP